MNRLFCTVAMAVTATAATTAFAASPVDQAFVAKVSQGGMFEVKASQIAEQKASAQDVIDFATAEVHDHTLVGDKLKAISADVGIPIDDVTNAMFQAKLDRLMGLSGPDFDSAYMTEMADIHAKDGGAFAKEAVDGATPAYRAFAAETHKIVQRHIGAIRGASPPVR